MNADEAFRLFASAPREHKLAVGQLLWDAIAEADDDDFREALRFTALVEADSAKLKKLIAEADA